ncbi:MAG: hypothetical protein O9302_14750 [Cyclobacteriaceae bacterium]|jgi:hypothetical protein|nr:hypothetical protein [Flammeovirgaceae bacterium]MCZ8021872.1 hypothetical protein [Cytophagales bacterium]MCZ8329321.1 hypothetical protein [Cyclobacteriaceae bacterium]
MNRMFESLREKPKSIFLVDAVGAFASLLSLLIFIFLTDELDAIPTRIKVGLSILICVFIGCGMAFYFLAKSIPTFLRIVITYNILYAGISFILLLIYFDEIKWIGKSYLIIEILILIGVVVFERYFLSFLKQKS